MDFGQFTALAAAFRMVGPRHFEQGEFNRCPADPDSSKVTRQDQAAGPSSPKALVDYYFPGLSLMTAL